MKERVKSAPKKLIRRGLDDGTERLRGQLRDVAQHGQRDDFGGDQLGDAEVSGVKRAEQLAERLLGKRKKGAAHNPDTGPNGHSGHDPQGAAKPRDDGILPPRDRLHGREARDPLQAQSALQKPQKRSIKTKDAYLKIQADPAPLHRPVRCSRGKRPLYKSARVPFSAAGNWIGACPQERTFPPQLLPRENGHKVWTSTNSHGRCQGRRAVLVCSPSLTGRPPDRQWAVPPKQQ